MKTKKALITIFSVLLAVSMPLMAFAHSGRTDSRGGHRDNKNKSGLGYYHYHCGGYPPHLHTGGVCPYKSSTTSTGTTSKTVYATKITAVNVPATINNGESTQLKGAVYPTNAQDKTIEWTSNNPEIVTVTSSGELHAVGVGKATVTATTSRGTKTTFTITVKEVIAENITIEDKLTTMLLDETKSLSVAFTPENTTNKNIEWTSDNAEIISVTTDGKVTAKSLGTATITATHGELTDICVIEVLPIEAESIEIIFPAEETDTEDTEANRVKKGNQIELKAIIAPENTTDKTVKWSVSDTSKAEIDENGKLTAISSGTVTVTATTSNGIKATIEVEVYSHTAAGVAGVGGTAAIAGGIYYFIRKRRTV